jgi:hypothetical protein
MAEMIEKSSIETCDLRGNHKISAMVRASPKFVLGTVPEVSGNDRKSSREERLRQENSRLRRRLDQIIGYEKVAVVNERTFIIGERSLDLAEHIYDLEALCAKLAKETKRRLPSIISLT